MPWKIASRRKFFCSNFPIIGALRKEKFSVVLKSAQIISLAALLGEVSAVVKHRRFVHSLMSCRKFFGSLDKRLAQKT